MTRSKLKRRYNLDRTTINFENYKKQRNTCVTLLRKSEKQYFNNIDVKNVTDNKKFSKTSRPKFSHTCKTANNYYFFFFYLSMITRKTRIYKLKNIQPPDTK